MSHEVVTVPHAYGHSATEVHLKMSHEIPVSHKFMIYVRFSWMLVVGKVKEILFKKPARTRWNN